MTTLDDVSGAVVAYATDQVNAATAPLNAQLANDQITITSDVAQIAALQAEVAALTAPPPPVFTVGIDINLVGISGQTLAEREALSITNFGTSNRRFKAFDAGQGPEAAYNNFLASGYGKAPGETEVLLCFKRLNAADIAWLTNFIKTYSGTIVFYLVFYQEPEDEFGKGTLAVQAYDTNYSTLFALIAGFSKFKLAVCLNNYQEDQVAGSTKWPAFLTPLKGKIDLVGLDDYDSDFDPVTWTPDAFLADGPAAAKALGCEWGVTEFGAVVSSKTPGDTATAAIARLLAAIAYTKANGGTSFNYWYSAGWAATPGLDAALKSAIAA